MGRQLAEQRVKMRLVDDKSSLSEAQRIYNCPYFFTNKKNISTSKNARTYNNNNSDSDRTNKKHIDSKTANENYLRNYLKTDVKYNNNNTLRGKIPYAPPAKPRPKKESELTDKQKERLQQLFSIYAEESSRSYRTPAHQVGELPKLFVNKEGGKRISSEYNMKNNNNTQQLQQKKEKDVLPKINYEPMNAKKRHSSRNSDVVYLPSIN